VSGSEVKAKGMTQQKMNKIAKVFVGGMVWTWNDDWTICNV